MHFASSGIFDRRIEEADGLDSGEGDRDAEIRKGLPILEGFADDRSVVGWGLGLKRVDLAMSAPKRDED